MLIFDTYVWDPYKISNTTLDYWFPAFYDAAYSHSGVCLASQDAIEVMSVTHSLSDWLIVRIDLTDVTLVSDDT